MLHTADGKIDISWNMK